MNLVDTCNYKDQYTDLGNQGATTAGENVRYIRGLLPRSMWCSLRLALICAEMTNAPSPVVTIYCFELFQPSHTSSILIHYMYIPLQHITSMTSLQALLQLQATNTKAYMHIIMPPPPRTYKNKSKCIWGGLKSNLNAFASCNHRTFLMIR